MATADNIKEAIKKAAPEGKLSCAKAFQIADELDVARKIVGDMANEMKIKISTCQLGCFK